MEFVLSKKRSDSETCECKDCMVITIRNEGPALQKSMKFRSKFYQNWECVSECIFYSFLVDFGSILDPFCDQKSIRNLCRILIDFLMGLGRVLGGSPETSSGLTLHNWRIRGGWERVG